MEIPVIKGALSFWISLAAFVLAGLLLLGVRAAKRHRLGKVLWASRRTALLWAAIIWLATAGLRIAQIALSSAARDGGFNILIACLYFSCAVLYAYTFSITLVSVHEGGVCIGLLCFSWPEVAGWSWGLGDAPGDVALLKILGRDRRGLCVWTTSRWQVIYEPRPQWPICTRITRNGGLEALLHKYAPQAERS